MRKPEEHIVTPIPQLQRYRLLRPWLDAVLSQELRVLDHANLGGCLRITTILRGHDLLRPGAILHDSAHCCAGCQGGITRRQKSHNQSGIAEGVSAADCTEGDDSSAVSAMYVAMV